MNNTFNEHFLKWVNSACGEWGYPEPSIAYYKVNNRVPVEVRAILGEGIKQGIIPNGPGIV